MTTFLTVIARPAVQGTMEKPLFGKPFVRIGRLFAAVGYWVFQQGGLLGYALRENPVLLGKLIAPPGVTDVNMEDLKKMSERVASHLEEVKDEEKTFFYLYTVRELRQLGIDPTSWPPSKDLARKTNVEFLGDVMRISFVQGVSLGFSFPEQFSTYWENTYRMRPDSEWEEMRNRGIVLSDIQEERTQEQAIVEIAENAILWGTNETPRVLDANDIEYLEGIIKANRS